MKRDIKFRYWNEIRKRFENQFDEIYMDTEGVAYGFINTPGDNHLSSYQLTPCQYTGFKDKNDREIYEGDIIQLPKRDIIAKVEWKEESAGMVLISVRENKFIQLVYSIGYTHNGEKAEVIGNIYQTPELLK